jgi:hypothetical protein
MMYQPASPANQTIAAAVCVIMISKVLPGLFRPYVYDVGIPNKTQY